MKKDYLVLLNQLDGNFNSFRRFDQMVWSSLGDSPEDDQSIWLKRRKLSSHQVDSRESSNLSSEVSCMVDISNDYNIIITLPLCQS